MDLLLYLVKRDGIDLARFPVAKVADSYLQWLDRLDAMHISVAAEYLVMAATLLHLKSLALLPKPRRTTDPDDVVGDPVQALARRIEEYQRYKEVADGLSTRPWLGREVFTREPVTVGDEAKRVVPGVDAFGLLDVYYHLLTRKKAPEPVVIVSKAGPDFGQLCRFVLGWLHERGKRAQLGDLLQALPTVEERIVAFLGLLEMTRLQWVEVEQREHLGPVRLLARVGPDVDLDIIKLRVVESS